MTYSDECTGYHGCCKLLTGWMWRLRLGCLMIEDLAVDGLDNVVMTHSY
jgi:hypothetical protein